MRQFIGPLAARRAAGIAVAAAGATAVTAVLLYRTLTFWLRAPAGWLALRYLQHREVL